MLKNLLSILLFFCTFALRAVNSAPTNIFLSSTSIAENNAPLAVVGNLSSADIDILDTHTYSLVAGAGGTNNASFSIVGTQLKGNVAFNYEFKNSYSIRIRTIDGSGAAYDKVFIITINDVNETPVYNDASVSIAENSANASNIITVTGTDVDAGQTLSYSIVSGNTGGAFAINSVTGQLTVNTSSALDYETTPVFNLVIRATDNGAGSLFDNAALTINLTNVNDAPVNTVPGAQSVFEFTNLSIAGISVNDQDIASDSLLMNISVSHGKVTLSSLAGLRFTLGDGIYDASITFYGKKTDVNTALNNLVYKSDDDYVGADVLVLSTNDQGSTGPGGAKTDIDNIAITVNSVAVTFNTQPSGATICQTRQHLFVVNVSGTNPISYQWKHNGSSVLLATNDSLLIDSADVGDAGTYQCFVSNPSGTVTSNLVNLVVNANPLPSFTYNEVCVGGTTSFTNTSVIDYDNLISYSWDFDDLGTSSIAEDPQRIFSNDGTFQVQLIAESDLGCIDTVVQSVIVNPYPLTNFVIGDICFVDSLKPLNTTTINVGTVSSLWNFGDGSTSSVTSPAHKYVSTDSYILSLVSTSNKGCSTSKNQTVTVNPSPIANFVVDNICDSTEALFQGVSSISSGTIDYRWILGDGDTVYNDVNPIHLYDGAATYNVQLYVWSDKGCADSVVKSVIVYPNPSVNVVKDNVKCFGETTGSFSIIADGSKAPYFYSINGGLFTLDPVFEKLPASVYHILVQDIRNCKTLQTIEITQPPKLMMNYNLIEDVKCATAATGSIEVGVSGGTYPYIYWMNKMDNDTNLYKYDTQDTGVFYNLSAKLYPMYVSDIYGCGFRFASDVHEPAALALSINQTNISCKGFSDGDLTLNANGGVGPYTYSVNGGLTYQGSNYFNNLNASNYIAHVKDFNGCGKSYGINLVEPTDTLRIQSVIQSNVACKGDSSAVIRLYGNGGTGVVEFALNSNAFGTQSIYESIPAGIHKFFSKDEKGCLDSVSVNVTEPNQVLQIDSVDIDDVKCFGAHDASIQVFAQGGTGFKKFCMFNSFQSDSVFRDLGIGDFTVCVKDANSCKDSLMVHISQPQLLQWNSVSANSVDCKNELNGNIMMDAIGGVLPYSFKVNNQSQNNGNFSGLGGGDYSLKVVDANLCSMDSAISISYNKELAKADFNSFISGKAITFNNHSLNALNYEWLFGDNASSLATIPVHQYSSNGVYTVKLIASNTCNSDTLSELVNIGGVAISVVDVENLFAVYPNPADQQLNIKSNVFSLDNEFVSIEVFDMLGRSMYQDQFKSSGVIDLSKFSNGKYFLRINSKQNNIIYPFDVIH